MPRLINLADQKNLWGATTDTGLEPQRSDLWLVDLTQLVAGLNSQGIFSRLKLAAVPKFLVQFVQSITLPELKMKPDVFRRDSVPYNMPSWDEPLDPVKISFIVDTYGNPNKGMVTSVLQAWQAIVRAGRGDRSSLYADADLAIPLNGNYRYDYMFPIRVSLLRGGLAEEGSLTPEQTNMLNYSMVYTSQQANDYQDNFQAAMARGDVESAVTYAQLANPESTSQAFLNTERRPLAQQPWLQIASNWQLVNCWLGGWKLTDLSYMESKLQLAEAVIYAEDFYETTVT